MKIKDLENILTEKLNDGIDKIDNQKDKTR